MDDIAELQRRIAGALERIRGSAGAMVPQAAAPAEPDPALAARMAEAEAEVARLTGALSEAEEARTALTLRLEEEKGATALLEERVEKLKERQDTKLAGLEAAVAGGRARLADMGRELQGLREVNTRLRAVIEGLRGSLGETATDPELINTAMAAELDALRALRDSEAAEIRALIAELAPEAGDGGSKKEEA